MMNKTTLVVLAGVIVAAVGYKVWDSVQEKAWRRNQAQAAQELAQQQQPSAETAEAQSAQDELTALIVSMNKELDVAQDAAIPSVKDPIVVVPFTGPDGVITGESLAVYFPALFKSCYSPHPVLFTPYPWRTMESARIRGMLTPGDALTAEQISGMTRALGCPNYVKGALDLTDSAAVLRLEILWRGKIITPAPLQEPRDRLAYLPGRAAMEILNATIGKKIAPETSEFLKRPAAPSTEALIEAGELARVAVTRYWDTDFQRMSEIDDDSLDWMNAIRILAITSKTGKIFEAAAASARWREQSLFQLLLAEAYFNNNENARAADIAGRVTRRHSQDFRAWEILGWTLKKLRKPPAAKAYYDRMQASWSDSAYANIAAGQFYVDLAWHYRGGGWASTVTDEGWEKFHANLDKADQFFARAIERDPLSFRAWTERIQLKKAQGDDHAFWESFYKAVEINRDFPYSYSILMNFIQTKWGGAPTDLPKFWNWVMNEEFDNPYVYLTVADSIHEQARSYAWNPQRHWPDDDRMKDFLDRPVVWNVLEKAFTRLLDKVDDPNERAHYAYLLARSGREAEAVEQFKLTRHEFTNTDYVPAESLYYTWAICARKLGLYDHCIEVCDMGIKKNLGMEVGGEPNERLSRWRQEAIDKKNAMVRQTGEMN